MATLRIMGVDPGFASTGVAVVEQRVRRLHLVHGQVIQTVKGTQRAASVRLRVSVDDSRRVRDLYGTLVALVRKYAPNVICVESYVPAFGNRGNAGNAWKTAITFGVVHAVALQFEHLCLAFLPMDLKREFKVAKGASKATVAEAVCERVQGLAQTLAALPKGQREHVSDAAGHAVLGHRETAELRRSLGEVDV